jgi:hypothetical protein
MSASQAPASRAGGQWVQRVVKLAPGAERAVVELPEVGRWWEGEGGVGVSDSGSADRA